MVQTTTAQLFVKLPQFIVEVTEGATPTASPSFTTCGFLQSLQINQDGNFVDVSQVGIEDLTSIIQGLAKYELKLKLFVTASTFVKRAINSANFSTPAGTISESFSMAWSQYVGGTTEFFTLAKGCRMKDITITMEVGKPTQFDITIICLTLTTPFSTANAGLTTPSWASNPAGTVWSHLDGGANPLSWNAAALNAKKIAITIQRNTNVDFTLGNLTGYSSQSHARRITADYQGLIVDQILETDFKTPSARTMALVLKSAVSTITLSTTNVTTYKKDESGDETEADLETASFKALTVSCT